MSRLERDAEQAMLDAAAAMADADTSEGSDSAYERLQARALRMGAAWMLSRGFRPPSKREERMARASLTELAAARARGDAMRRARVLTFVRGDTLDELTAEFLRRRGHRANSADLKRWLADEGFRASKLRCTTTLARARARAGNLRKA